MLEDTTAGGLSTSDPKGDSHFRGLHSGPYELGRAAFLEEGSVGPGGGPVPEKERGKCAQLQQNSVRSHLKIPISLGPLRMF